MGCGRDVRVDMLSLATFCQAIAEVLVNFCDEGQSHADLWTRVKGAIKFLDLFSEQGPLDFFPKFGFRGSMNRLTYEQRVVTKDFLKEREKKVRETKRKLPLILDLQLSSKQRRAAAGYCIKLFSALTIHYLYYFHFPPSTGVPRGIRELLEEKGKKPRRVTRPKTADRSEGKK